MQPDERRKAVGGLAVALILAVALLPRLTAARTASLHLDDFHSLHHARNLVSGPFWEVLLQDNHPPLSFVILGGFRALFGEAPWVLRLPNVAFGLAAVLLAVTWARRVPGPSSSRWTGLALALSPLHVVLTSDLRMYGLLALASVGFLEALASRLEGAGHRSVSLVLWAWIGLHTHYHFLHLLALTSLFAAWLAWRRPSLRARLKGLLIPAGVLFSLALPWYALGFPRQLAHGLSPGGSAVDPRTALESILHLAVHRVSLAGTPLRGVLAALGVLAVGLVFLGLRAGRRERRPAAYVLAAGLALGLPLWTAAAAALVPRAGFEWRYLAAATAPFAVAFGASVGRPGAPPWVRGLGTAALLGMAVNTAFCARDPGREDYRSAVRFVLEQRHPGDAVLAADWQPRLFPHSIGWHYYAPRLADGPLGPELRYTPDFDLEDPSVLEGLGRVFCVLRSIPNEVPFLKRLRRAFPRESAHRFGESIFVLVFERETPRR